MLRFGFDRGTHWLILSIVHAATLLRQSVAVLESIVVCRWQGALFHIVLKSIWVQAHAIRILVTVLQPVVEVVTELTQDLHVLCFVWVVSLLVLWIQIVHGILLILAIPHLHHWSTVLIVRLSVTIIAFLFAVVVWIQIPSRLIVERIWRIRLGTRDHATIEAQAILREGAVNP